MASIGIIGGGIAGLTAAWRLRQRGHAVQVFEASGRTGGKIRSERAGGYLIEHGPSALRAASPALRTLMTDLGLDQARVEADPAARRRYVVKDGRPVPLPASPAELLRTPLLSARGKLRLLAEPLVRRADPAAEESVAAFTRRRLGVEALRYGVDPFVAGVFAGDPARPALPYAFPKLHALEQRYGSVLAGSLRRALERRGANQAPEREAMLFSLRGGLQRLPDTLAARLDGGLALETPVTALRPAGSGWHLEAAGRGASTFDAVLWAAPLHALGAVAFETGLDLSLPAQVPHPPVAVVSLGVRRADVAHPLDGFGLLVPSAERLFRILGVLFTSTLFPERAPEGRVLLTVFTGGTRHPALGRAGEGHLMPLVLHDLARLLGARKAPVFARCTRWPRAIPQYTLGYGRVLQRIDRLQARHPGFYMAGNYRQGIAVGDAVASADEAARRLAAHLA